jgi:hypothetical protein
VGEESALEDAESILEVVKFIVISAGYALTGA